MGADFTAYAIVGIRVPHAKLHHTVPNTMCRRGHKVDSTLHQYCPACGLKVEATMQTEIEAFDVRDGQEYGHIAGFVVVPDTNKDVFFICALVVRNEYGEIMNVARDLSGVSGYRDAMEKALTSLGLWDESQFGLWAMLYCSC